MTDRRKYGRRFFRGWVLTVLWAVLSAGILLNAYGSHLGFRSAVTRIFNEEQVLNVHLLQRMVLDHVDEATQTLRHAVMMIKDAPPGRKGLAMNIDMVLRDHDDDFLSASVITLDGEILYHTRGPDGENPLQKAEIEKVKLAEIEGPAISERIYSPDGEPSTFLIIPFRIAEEGQKLLLFGELRLKSFLSEGMRGFQGENISFVVMDYRGDIYYIANLDHQKKDFMEHGSIFILEEGCLECHSEQDFSDVSEAVATGVPIHAVFKSPEGRLVNRTSALFKVLNEQWVVSISVPYESLQGQIEGNFNRTAGSAVMFLLLAGSGSLLLYVNNKQRALEQHYYSIIDSIEVGLCRLDGAGVIESANPALRRLLGEPPETDLTGRSFYDYCQAPERLKECGAAPEGNVFSSDCEVEIKRSDGLRFQGLISLKTIPGNRTDLVVSDITDRKMAEAGLRRAKEKLERQNEELQKVDRIKDALISDVSHELKTPVAKQVMNIDILRHLHESIGAGEKVAEVMDAMAGNIRRQQSTIRNILMTSRLEGGGRKFRFDAVRLDKLLDGVIGEHMHSLAAHGVRLEQKLTEAVVGADEEMLWHVFSNVIDNAIKYRAETNPSLSVIMKVRGAEVTVRISDNGVGLSPEEQERVFERFFQSSSATEGIGLGLFICKNMLESMGGSIGLSSEGKGKGVTVDIRLPLG